MGFNLRLLIAEDHLFLGILVTHPCTACARLASHGMTFPLLRAQPLVALDEGPNDRPRIEAWPHDDEESAESRAKSPDAKPQPP